MEYQELTFSLPKQYFSQCVHPPYSLEHDVESFIVTRQFLICNSFPIASESHGWLNGFLTIASYSFTKPMVSHDLVCSTVTDQIAFDKRDSKFIPKFERMMDGCCQVLVFKLKTLDAITMLLAVSQVLFLVELTRQPSPSYLYRLCFDHL